MQCEITVNPLKRLQSQKEMLPFYTAKQTQAITYKFARWMITSPPVRGLDSTICHMQCISTSPGN